MFAMSRQREGIRIRIQVHPTLTQRRYSRSSIVRIRLDRLMQAWTPAETEQRFCQNEQRYFIDALTFAPEMASLRL